MPIVNAAERAAVIEALIPMPPADIAPLRIAFSTLLSNEWEAHVPGVLSAISGLGVTEAQAAKARFIAEMYARGCYSMLMLSAAGPSAIRLAVRATVLLPRSRELTILAAGRLLAGLHHVV